MADLPAARRWDTTRFAIREIVDDGAVTES